MFYRSLYESFALKGELMAKFSIIIPVYNTEKFLHACIDSVLAQKFADFELILVDDGSTDSSGRICDEYKDPRIKVIHRENSGVSVARNIGINAASGEYMMFVDADDTISPHTLTVCDKTVCDSDLLMFSYARTGKGKLDDTSEPINAYDLTEKDRDELIKNVIYYKEGTLSFEVNCNHPVTKVYRTEIIKENKLIFPAGVKIAEDKYFNFSAFPHCKKIRHIDNRMYLVTDHANSATARYMDDCITTNMCSLLGIREMIGALPDSEEYMKRYYCALTPVIRNALTLDYCHADNKNSYAKRKEGFEAVLKDLPDFYKCDLKTLNSYDRYLHLIFCRSFFVINAVMRHRLIRGGMYYLYKYTGRL